MILTCLTYKFSSLLRFQCSAPAVWNSLPKTVLSTDSALLQFLKSRLKSFLFSRAFFFSAHWRCLAPAPMKLRPYGHYKHTQTHTHTRLTSLCLGLPGWAGTRKEKPIWILLKQETVSGSSINWVVCKSAPRSRQITITTPASHHSVFYRPDALPAAQPTASKHWRHYTNLFIIRTGIWHCSWLWLGVFDVAGQLICWHATLDGAGGHPSDGRGTVRRQSGRVVTRHHLHWAW